MLQIENWRLLNLTVDIDGKIKYPAQLENVELFNYFEDPLEIKNTLMDQTAQGITRGISVNGVLRSYMIFWKIENKYFKILAIYEPTSYSEAASRAQFYTTDKKIIKASMKIDSFDKKLYLKSLESDFLETFSILDIISSEKNILGLDFAGRNSAVNFFSDLLNMRDPNPIMFKSKFYKNTTHLFFVSAKKKPKTNEFIGEFCIIDEFLDRYKDFFQNNIYYELPNVVYKPTFVGFVNNYLSIDENQGILGILDIDNFSLLDNKYTFKEANNILDVISNRLSEFVNKIGSITNLREDKFIIFIPSITTDLQIHEILTQLLDIVRSTKIQSLPDEQFTATIGVSMFPKYGKDYETLLKQANNALFSGKFFGKNRYRIFDINVNKYHRNSLPELSYLNFYKDFFHTLLMENNIDKAVDFVLDLTLHFFNFSRILMLEQTYNKVYLFSKFKESTQAKGIKNFTFDNMYPFIEGLKPIEYIDVENNDSTFALFLKSKLNFSKGYVIHFFEESKYFGLFVIESDLFTELETDEFVNLFYSTFKTVCNYLYSKDAIEKQTFADNKDSLTSLLNLTGFNLVGNEIVRKKISEYTIVSFDIKNFGFINDFYGYSVGNKILQFIGISLKKLINKDEEICHISADHFLILLHSSKESEILNRKSIIFEDIKYFRNNNLTIHLHYSIGAYIIKNSDDLHHSIDYANKARLATKVQDFTTINFYNSKYQEKELLNRKLELMAEEAIEKEEFYAVYQPCYDAKTEKIVSGEALVRWKHEDKIFYPDQFIPYLEKTGLIVNMDFIVYENVCKLLQTWKNDKIKLIPISVNVSRCHLLTGNFVERLEALVEKYEIDRKYICLEITESMFVSGQQGYAIITELHNKGYNIYLDDFGTAYSNLKALSTINFDVIKIDKSLVDDICTTQKALTIFKSVIGMSKALGLRILVEGVEDQGQLRLALKEKCDIIQGYIFSKPIELDAFDKKIRDQFNK